MGGAARGQGHSWIAALAVWLAIIAAGLLKPSLVFDGASGAIVALLGLVILVRMVLALRR